MKLAEGKKGYTRQAGLGPWSQLLDEGMRLQVLNHLGRNEEVLKYVEDLMEQMKNIPEESDHVEAYLPWNVRELIVDAGRQATLKLNKMEKALELNAELIKVTRSRGATKLELAKTCFNDYGPMLSLKRYVEAEKLLAACREVFEEERSIEMLGKVFIALASLKYRLGQKDQAIRFLETAFRYTYPLGNPVDISNIHHNLASYLSEAGLRSALDHRMASASIRYYIGSGNLASSLRLLARDLAKFGPVALPSSFNQLVYRLELLEGVQFRELLEKLPKRYEDGDQLLKNLVKMAKSAKP